MYELRASSLGSCTKAQAAILQGYAPLPTPDKVQGWYDRGNVHEEECAAAIRAEGWVITEEQDAIELSFGDLGTDLTGHLDGIIRHDTLDSGDTVYVKSMVWEAKAPGAWAKFQDAYKRNDWSDPLAHRYAWQISVYMVSTGLEALVCCLDDGVVKTFGIEVPPFSLAEIEQRVGEIIDFVEGGLPGSCSQNDWPCPVAYLHETPEVEEDEHLDVLVNQYGEFGAIIKAATESQKKVQTEIRQYLAGTDRTTAASKVTFYEQKASVKYDMELVDATLQQIPGVNLEMFRVAGKPSQRMKITKRGSDEPEEASGD